MLCGAQFLMYLNRHFESFSELHIVVAWLWLKCDTFYLFKLLYSALLCSDLTYSTPIHPIRHDHSGSALLASALLYSTAVHLLKQSYSRYRVCKLHDPLLYLHLHDDPHAIAAATRCSTHTAGDSLLSQRPYFSTPALLDASSYWPLNIFSP